MNYIFDPSSRKSRCNLFADFLLSKIDPSLNSILYVTDQKNFHVINGVTESKEILNMNEVFEEFNEKHKDFLKPITHTIDLINYGVKLGAKEKFISNVNITSENVSYHYKLIESYKSKIGSYKFDGHRVINVVESEKPIISSFPHGHSQKQGRILYYYAKHIGYNISDYLVGVNLSIELNTSHTDPIDFVDLDGTLDDESLKSYLLDGFDFNYDKLQKKLDLVDYSIEVLDPIKDLEPLREKVKLDVFI